LSQLRLAAEAARRAQTATGGGEQHYLVRYPAGLKGRPHQHTAAHTIIALEGQLDATPGKAGFAEASCGKPNSRGDGGSRAACSPGT